MNIISLGHLSFTTFWIEISIIVLNFLGLPSIIFGLLGPSEYYLDTRFAWFLLLGLYITFFIISFLFSWGYILFFGFFIFQNLLFLLDIYGLGFYVFLGIFANLLLIILYLVVKGF